MITDPEDYFLIGCGRCKRFATPDCSVRKWADGLKHLRQICRDVGLVETAKWGHPCYMHNGRNIALLGAFRGDFRLSYFNPALMKDPENVLVKRGPNTQNVGMMSFTDGAAVKRMEPVIVSYLEEAVGYADAGILPIKEPVKIELPDELVEAMDIDPELAEAFHKLTPSRQRSYVINLNGAKASATRTTRIEKFRDKIILGKGAMER
ncbi:YdeI family protein [Falsihalocynthiibacter sp. S25ZX9]|uniref:YdeI/OmpD-associated family protein n=1 Tax=Falsihalocynthiibacter sp. S25ZX9 TaxID=3240870 RepID=UPI00350F7EFE